MANPVQKRPEGFHTVNPYLVIDGAAKVIEFLKQAFGVRIGDSMVEIGDSPEPMPINLHVYVDDVDSLYRRAIAVGGLSVREPETTFYGDRSAGVKDPGGNNWWLACHVEDVSNEEIMRRATQQKS